MSRAGIQQIVGCDAGTLLAVPANAFAIGLRGKWDLNIPDFKSVNGHREYPLPVLKNFQAKGEALSVTMKLFKSLIDHLNGNVDFQIKTVKQSAAADSDDVFQFISAVSGLGIDFEYILTDAKKALNLTLERSMNFDAAKTFIDAADATNAIAIAGINDDGIDWTINRNPGLLAIESPKNTALFSVNDIVEKSLSIKTKGKKSIDNVTLVDWLTIELKIKAWDASVAKLVALMNASISPSIYMKEYTVGGVFYDAFDIAAGFLTQKSEPVIGDNDRTVTVTYSGDVPVYNASFLFGAGNGGDAVDTVGLKGGTFKIS